MHEVVMSHLFLPGWGSQVGHVLRVSSGLVGCAKAKGRRARRTTGVKMDFMVVRMLGFGMGVMVVLVTLRVVRMFKIDDSFFVWKGC